ncbi:amidase [Akanthomyces lecanii RCEF 1005]|uniref:Amidase n=1 Tax=Akanthomyces lecanii RCEF 1005 TaxID=1081108 RepID=A0A162N5A6_CORDF|nr:amidase [Akanthomyces lecanii RCEF 1005]
MRIACLQFAPQLAEVDQNIERADAILERADPQDIDLLVLPELAFSGYNFKSLGHISPHLELTEAGISTAWSRQAALKYDCVVVTGYPEKIDPLECWPSDPEYYNSAIIVDGDGDVVGNYRKSHLYYTDETWALEGRRGFYTGQVQGLGNMVLGICMDINPYKFEAPWEEYEFSSHVLKTGARLVVLSMAWCTHVDQEDFFHKPAEPDMVTLLYWITRLQPIISIDSNQETIIVFGNRCGAEGDATYVGTSTVLGIKSGEISLYGILGRDEESLLVVDTDALPYAKLNLQNQESAPVPNRGDDARETQDHHHGGPSEGRRNENASGTSTLNGMGTNQTPPTHVQEHTLDTIMITRGPERDPHQNDYWMETSRRPREHPTSGPFRVDGSSVGITSSSSHVSYTQFTQSHVAAPVTQQRDIDEMRPTMSEGNFNNNRLDEFSDGDEESLLSGSYSESNDESDGRRRHAASTQRGNRTRDAGKRYPTTHRSQVGLPNAHPEQDNASESSLVQRISAFALESEALPTSTTENFKEEDIYKYVRGENLTSEHHIRYHTHLLKERRARQGLPADGEDDEDDQEECQEEQEEDIFLEAHIDHNEPRRDQRNVTAVEPESMELPILVPASHNRLRTGLDTQPNYTFGSVAQTRQPFWQDHPAEPTPIADTPMSHMTQFSQTRTRRRHERQAPAFAMADSTQTRRQSQGRHAGEPDTGIKTGDSRAGEIRIASIPELASIDDDDHAAYNERLPALSRSKAKENSVPLQDPSRRPKAAARQVPPLRLVPREAPKEKQREREVRERSRRTPRQTPIAREAERPRQRDRDDRDRGRKTPVPMVLVYEGEGENMPLPQRRY